MAKTTFFAQVDAWTKKSAKRMTAVLRESAQRVIDQAQTVGPSVASPTGGSGGRMPVDTGFLRASMAVSFTGMPTGPSRNEGGTSVTYDGHDVTLVLARATPGQTIYAGWTAEYAPMMEERYGFMRGAAQNWQPIVRQVVNEAKARFP